MLSSLSIFSLFSISTLLIFSSCLLSEVFSTLFSMSLFCKLFSFCLFSSSSAAFNKSSNVTSSPSSSSYSSSFSVGIRLSSSLSSSDSSNISSFCTVFSGIWFSSSLLTISSLGTVSLFSVPLFSELKSSFLVSSSWFSSSSFIILTLYSGVPITSLSKFIPSNSLILSTIISFLMFTIGIFAYNAGAPFVPSSFAWFVSLTSIADSSIIMYFLITSIISCFISSRKSADTFALSCIKTKCNLSLAASLEPNSFCSGFTILLKKPPIFSNIIYPPTIFLSFAK